MTTTKPPSQPAPADAPSWPLSRLLTATLLVMLLTLALYLPVRDFGMIHLDDITYVQESAWVAKGLTLKGAAWAFDPGLKPYLMPFTRLSLMLDVTLAGGIDWSWLHMSNVLLHVLNTGLVFWLAFRLTGRPWTGLLVAALFGVHPQHVQGVAWVAERKEVLAGFFGLLAALAYLRQQDRRQRNGHPEARPAQARLALLPCLLFYLVSILSKPMWITLPAIFLLWDIFPLKRWPREGTWPLIREKLPFFMAGLALTWLSVRYTTLPGVMTTTSARPFTRGLTPIPENYVALLEKTFYPDPLALIYPVGPPPTWGEALLTLSPLVAITLAAWLLRRRLPWLTVGWLWFLIMLFPPVLTAGTATTTPMADHWTYAPHVGLFLAMAGSWPSAWSRRPPLRTLWLTLGGVAVAGMCFLSWRYLPAWRNDETLWRHGATVIPNNHLSLWKLGKNLQRNERYPQALEAFHRAHQANPKEAIYVLSLSNTLVSLGHPLEAILFMRKWLTDAPAPPSLLFPYGMSLMLQGIYPHAVDFLEHAAFPRNPDGPRNLEDPFPARVMLWSALVMSRQQEKAATLLQALAAEGPDKPQRCEALYVNSLPLWKERPEVQAATLPLLMPYCPLPGQPTEKDPEEQ